MSLNVFAEPQGQAHSVQISSQLEKHKNGDWTVLFTAAEPVKRIAFARNPDASRIERWEVLNNDLMIIYGDDQEFIVNKTDSLFESAQIKLTPTYTHLAKDYAPFSPYSDGGTLVHSGRFFSCGGTCNEQDKEWRISLRAPKEDFIIVDGRIQKSGISWLDSSNGKNIYVGPQKPTLSESFTAIVDQGLPDKIRSSLQSDIPKMIELLQSKLGELPNHQQASLFASYAKVDGTSTQGGVLDNQIFIHWDHDDLDKQVGNQRFINDLLWTFAHEVGHLYQRSASFISHNNEAWIHEGHAEMLAFNTLKLLYPDSHEYLSEKVKKFKQQCVEGLEETSLTQAANDGKFGLYYSCGFLIHQAIQNSVKQQFNHENSVYDSWNRFREISNKTGVKGEDSFLQAIAELTGKYFADRLKRFVYLKHLDPLNEVHSLTELAK